MGSNFTNRLNNLSGPVYGLVLGVMWMTPLSTVLLIFAAISSRFEFPSSRPIDLGPVFLLFFGFGLISLGAVLPILAGFIHKSWGIASVTALIWLLHFVAWPVLLSLTRN